MHLLNAVYEAAGLFARVTHVKRYLELRGQVQKDCPGGWYLIKELELQRWRQFGGIPHALSNLRQNLIRNPKLLPSVGNDIRSLIGHEAIHELEDLARELSGFVDGLSSYFLRPDTNLQAGPLDLPSALRRSLLNIKGCLMGLEEVRRIRTLLANKTKDTDEKTKTYEQEMLRRKIKLPISPESYSLILEVAGPVVEHRRILVATKQLVDMLKTIQELLFQATAYGQELQIRIDEASAALQYEEKPFGRLVRCHMGNIPPLVIPGQILRLEKSSQALPVYVETLAVNWQYNGKTKSSAIDLTGIDLEEAGPRIVA